MLFAWANNAKLAVWRVVQQSLAGCDLIGLTAIPKANAFVTYLTSTPVDCRKMSWIQHTQELSVAGTRALAAERPADRDAA